MCRYQLPVWQRLADDTGLAVVCVAVDVQGPEVVRPWIERFGISLTTLVDRHAQLAERVGVASVPLVLALEDGQLSHPATSINVLDEEQAEAVHRWAVGRADRIELPALPQHARNPATEAARAWLTVARLALEGGQRQAALEALEHGFELDPDNWLIRKQRWALSDPDRFYAGDIDLDWQEEQRQAGR